MDIIILYVSWRVWCGVVVVVYMCIYKLFTMYLEVIHLGIEHATSFFTYINIICVKALSLVCHSVSEHIRIYANKHYVFKYVAYHHYHYHNHIYNHIYHHKYHHIYTSLLHHLHHTTTYTSHLHLPPMCKSTIAGLP